MLEALARDLEVRVVTRDRDLGDRLPYPGIRVGEWIDVHGGKVAYVGKGLRYVSGVLRIVRNSQYDAIYLNSYFDSATLPILAFEKMGHRRPIVVLAPRGELSPGAVGLKKWKKSIYARLAQRLGLHKNIIWHASSPMEMVGLRASLHELSAESSPVVELGLPDVLRARDGSPQLGFGSTTDKNHRKRSGEARFVFVSRIVSNKNLMFALSRVVAVAARRPKSVLTFDIYGPVEDVAYWQLCQRLVRSAPPNCRIDYRGPLSAGEVSGEMAKYDCLLLPTHFENFGHVIAEALSVGLPAMVSDRTPWLLDPTTGGWTLPLEKPADWETAIEDLVALDDHSYRALSAGCPAGLQSLDNLRTASSMLLELISGNDFGTSPDE